MVEARDYRYQIGPKLVKEGECGLFMHEYGLIEKTDWVWTRVIGERRKVEEEVVEEEEEEEEEEAKQQQQRQEEPVEEKEEDQLLQQEQEAVKEKEEEQLLQQQESVKEKEEEQLLQQQAVKEKEEEQLLQQQQHESVETKEEGKTVVPGSPLIADKDCKGHNSDEITPKLDEKEMDLCKLLVTIKKEPGCWNWLETNYMTLCNGDQCWKLVEWCGQGPFPYLKEHLRIAAVEAVNCAALPVCPVTASAAKAGCYCPQWLLLENKLLFKHCGGNGCSEPLCCCRALMIANA
ncbi:hypothetical protein Fmac_009806 [Flemingia macrophylla]|uniref:Uncharacterized protein n=1 Tax=Flemingia macrophylla TaxID=520843 RepID=A0ABD1N1W2_9FABA